MTSKRRPPSPRDARRSQEEELLARLRELYREVDAAFKGYGCAASTDCCRFGVTGREPYVTSLELVALRRAVAARGGALSEKRRALPIYSGHVADERPCPLLDRTGRCSVYDARPLGCRTFWCERADDGGLTVSRDRVANIVRRLQDLAAEHEHDGERGRPLTRALGT